MNKITLCLVLCLCCVPFSYARVINVSNHGIVPGKDASLKLNQLIESVKSEEGITLFFPKGQYDFHPDNALERYRAIANHDNGLKRMAFPLFDANNITIDGNGSLFMFHGRMVPFTLERVQGATLKNFTIDWIRPFHAELHVIESNPEEKYFIVKTDPKKYPFSIRNGSILFDRFNQQDPIGSNIVFNPKTRSPIYATRNYHINSNSVTIKAIDKEHFKVTMSGKKQPPPLGSIWITYGVHPTSRLCPAIHVTNSKNLSIENVTVHEAGGMALIVERTENIDMNRLTVTSGDDRTVSTRADATHFIGCKGRITLKNSLLEHMLDDGINVHGAYVNIDSYLGNNQFIASISHFQQLGLIFGEPGDNVAILSRETVLPFFETSIKAIKPINEKRFLITLDKVPSTLPKGPMSLENLSWHPDVTMQNNKIHENRARSALITTKGKVLIENNYFSSQMNGILIEGDNKKWYESGAVEDVTIRNNTFANIGFSAETHYPLYASPMLTSQQRMGEGHYHRNIHFIGNTLESFNGHIAFARSVQGLIIKNNVITFSKDYPALNKHPSVDLGYVDKVELKNNKAEGFSNKLSIIKSDDSTRVSIKKNKGFIKR